VNNALFVGGLECIAYLAANLQPGLTCGRPLGDVLGQRLTRDVLEHQERHAPDVLEAVDGGDVRMVELREDAGLALEAGEAFRVAGEGFGQNFDGNVAAERGVGGAVDDAHAAGAELGVDAVVAQRLADHAGLTAHGGFRRLGLRLIGFKQPPPLALRAKGLEARFPLVGYHSQS